MDFQIWYLKNNFITVNIVHLALTLTLTPSAVLFFLPMAMVKKYTTYSCTLFSKR